MVGTTLGTLGISEAQAYLHNMRKALVATGHLMNPNSVYYGREGHLRLAKECGIALRDFDTRGRREILSGSYSAIYVAGCNLKPILDAKEWITAMRAMIS